MLAAFTCTNSFFGVEVCPSVCESEQIAAFERLRFDSSRSLIESELDSNSFKFASLPQRAFNQLVGQLEIVFREAKPLKRKTNLTG